MTKTSPASRIFVSIDTPEVASARGLAERLADRVGGIKLGLEFFVGQGPAGIRSVVSGIGLPLFIDLKLHDIPNTVAAAVRAMLPLQPTFLTIHTSGGPAMMRAAAEAALMTDLQRPRLLGVTVLTSLDDDDLVSVGQSVPVLDQARRLASLAQSSGLDGVICSPAEALDRPRCRAAAFRLPNRTTAQKVARNRAFIARIILIRMQA